MLIRPPSGIGPRRTGPFDMGFISYGGGLRYSYLSRMDQFLNRLGPVWGAGIRVAPRLTNTLKAGTPVSEMSALAGCKAIWVEVPEKHLDRILTQLVATRKLTKERVLISGTTRSASSFPQFEGSTLHVATVLRFEETERCFAGEGDPEALKWLMEFFTRAERQLIWIPKGGKPAFLAGLDMLSRFLDPWVEAASECFRVAGVADTLSLAWMPERRLKIARRFDIRPRNAAEAEERRAILAEKRPIVAELYQYGSDLTKGRKRSKVQSRLTARSGGRDLSTRAPLGASY